MKVKNVGTKFGLKDIHLWNDWSLAERFWKASSIHS